jgi:hypothetical protein
MPNGLGYSSSYNPLTAGLPDIILHNFLIKNQWLTGQPKDYFVD